MHLIDAALASDRINRRDADLIMMFFADRKSCHTCFDPVEQHVSIQ